MNDHTLLQLKTLVERAVRPVRASDQRKHKMRQELLAHITAIFDDEMSRFQDQTHALIETARRFGNPAELTSQLQTAVPASDRIKRLIDRFWFRRGENGVWRAFRQSIFIEFLILVALAIPWLLAGAPTRIFSEAALVRFGQFLIAFFAVSLCFTMLAERMRRALHGSRARSFRQIALITGVFAIVSFLFVVAIGLIEERWTQESLLHALPSVVFLTLWLTAGLAAFTKPLNERMRLEEEWAGLAI